MKKTAYILAAALLIGALSGCSGNNDGSADTTTVSNNGANTQIAYEAEEKDDTTDEAVEFLKTKVPLFAKYLEKRMECPLTYEVEIETDDGITQAAIYIKDEKNICLSSTDASGYTSRRIYTPDMLYVVLEKERIVCTNPMDEETIKEIVAANMLRIDVDEAKELDYVDDYDYFRDVLYKHEIIYTEPGVGTHYFYDENTDELVYIATNSSTTKVTCLKNEVTESAFEIPSDYEVKDLYEYADELEAQQAEQTAETE